MKFFNIAALAGATAAYKTSDKIVIDLFYESQCPACRDQITNNFSKAMSTKGFGKMATINLHPYGNATEKQSTTNPGQWDFTCQHGAVECQYNLLEACAIDQIDTKGKQSKHLPFNFIKCIENNDSSRTIDDHEKVATDCATQVGIPNVADLLTCVKGPAGNALEHKIAMATPNHNYVPWIVVDGQHSDTLQNSVGSNLLGYVCQNYKGANKAAACDQSFEFSTEDMDVCYNDYIVKSEN